MMLTRKPATLQDIETHHVRVFEMSNGEVIERCDTCRYAKNFLSEDFSIRESAFSKEAQRQRHTFLHLFDGRGAGCENSHGCSEFGSSNPRILQFSKRLGQSRKGAVNEQPTQQT
jgi:hypothetical protein